MGQLVDLLTGVMWLVVLVLLLKGKLKFLKANKTW